VVGAVIGNLLLGVAGYIGGRTGLPGMVLLRSPMGVRGSYAPTVLNVLQNIGWGAFELIIIATAAHEIARRALGVSSFVVWVTLFGAVCTLMAIGGPLVIVRRWIGRYAVWLVLISTIYLTWYALTRFDLTALWQKPGDGSLSFWLGVDLAIAMPISWIPLAADYTRFARRSRDALWGTAGGYFLAHVWFYVLGALFLLALQAKDLIQAVLAIPIGGLALLILLVDETDEAFANIYSTSVSLQNLLPRASQRMLAAGVGALCTALAATIPLARYESFLFLIGAFFVPLFGVLAADYFIVYRRRYDAEALSADSPRTHPGIRWRAVFVWAVGFVVYQWIAPAAVPGWNALLHSVAGALGVPFPLSGTASRLGASIPSFLTAFVLYAVIGRQDTAPARPRR
jgi:putative hydroxymethylpyrimidine transporter CytX